jgi:predicted translin family RNA/ssDNA-binding protein
MNAEHCLKENEWGMMSVEIATIKKDMAETKQDIKETKTQVNLINSKIDDLPDKLKDKFASKERFELVERAVYFVIALMCGLVITAIVYLAIGK